MPLSAERIERIVINQLEERYRLKIRSVSVFDVGISPQINILNGKKILIK